MVVYAIKGQLSDDLMKTSPWFMVQALGRLRRLTAFRVSDGPTTDKLTTSDNAPLTERRRTPEPDTARKAS